jgi:membrane-associated phospholipid phosphatase
MMPPNSSAVVAEVRSATRILLACTALVTLFFGVASFVWLQSSSLTVAGSNFVDAAYLLVSLAGGYLAGRFVLVRLKDDSKPIARGLSGFAVGLMSFTKACAVLLPFSTSSALFMYLAAATQAPLTDAKLAALDAAIGFDWLAFLATVNAMPLVSAALVFAYHSTGPLLISLFVFLSFTHREERLYELLALMALTTMCTAILQAMIPAAGAYALFQPNREAFSNFTDQAGMWHYAELVDLRAGKSFTYFAAKTSGMVTFPSFHTILGVITLYAIRDHRFLAPPVLVLNSLMIVATIPEGGHHLVDVLAGLVIAAACILFVRRLVAFTRQRAAVLAPGSGHPADRYDAIRRDPGVAGPA